MCLWARKRLILGIMSSIYLPSEDTRQFKELTLEDTQFSTSILISKGGDAYAETGILLPEEVTRLHQDIQGYDMSPSLPDWAHANF